MMMMMMMMIFTLNSTIPYHTYVLVSYSNFVRKIFRCSTSKMSWPRNPGERSLKLIENITIR